MITFNLKKKWYDLIKSGEKRIEYREDKPYWQKRLWKHPQPTSCILRLGYTKHYMTAKITLIERILLGELTDLRIPRPVFGIHLDEVKEEA